MNAFRILAIAALLTAAIPALVNGPICAADDLPPPAKIEKPITKRPAAYKIHGRCIDHADNSPVAGIRMLLFEIPGRTLPIVQIAETVADEKGHFEFAHLVPPRASDRLNRLLYLVVPFADDRPDMPCIIGHNLPQERQGIELRLNREEGTLSGRIVNCAGRAGRRRRGRGSIFI